MGIQLNSQPFCRWCGIAIRKKTITHHFGDWGTRQVGDHLHHIEKPTSKEEAQRHFNHQIVSVKWHQPYDYVRGNRVNTGPKYIHQVGIWDGVSYRDELFCSGKCEAALGRFVAKHHGWSTNDYRQAKEKGKSND